MERVGVEDFEVEDIGVGGEGIVGKEKIREILLYEEKRKGYWEKGVDMKKVKG